MNSILLGSVLAKFHVLVDSNPTVAAINQRISVIKEIDSARDSLWFAPESQKKDDMDSITTRYMSVASTARTELRPIETIQNVISLKDEAIGFLSEVKYDPVDCIKRFIDALDLFLNCYQDYLVLSDKKNGVHFIGAMRSFQSSIQKIKELHILTSTMYDTDNLIVDDSFQYITIGLSNRILSLNELASKASGISECYDAISLLFTRKKEIPLQVIKFETGSTWLKAVGSGFVLPVVVNVLSSAAIYKFEQYEKRSEIVSFGELDLEKLERIINIREKVEGLGMDVHGLDASIAKSLKMLSRSLDKVMYSEPEIHLNDTVYSIRREVKKEYLEYIAKKEIETREVQDSRHD